MSNEQRDEWLRLMIELGRLDRETYREVRSKAWSRVEKAHGKKSPAEIATWIKGAS